MNGVLPAGEAARRLVPLGLALAAAVKEAEDAPTEDARGTALAKVARIGEEVVTSIDPRWEEVRGPVSTLILGVSGQQVRRRFG